MSGGGRVKFGPCSLVSLYGVKRELWKTGWICQDFGRSQELIGVVVRILKGPRCLSVSLAFKCVVLTFVPFNQTNCPSLKVTNGKWGPFHIISSVATFRGAETSVWRQFRVLSHSSTDGRWEAKLTGGRNSGWKPYQIWNGECPVALWAWILWANLAKGSKSAQLSCW